MSPASIFRRCAQSKDLQIAAAAVAGAMVFGYVDGSMWRTLATPTLAYRPAILFGLTLVYGWRGFAWTQVVFFAAFVMFFGWRGGIIATPLHLFSHAGAYFVAQKLRGKEPWLAGERSTLAFLAGAFLAPVLPALLTEYALSLIGFNTHSQVSSSVEGWLRINAGILVIVPALLVNVSRSFGQSTGRARDRETPPSITRRSLLELGVEAVVWTATLWITVQFKARYGLNVTYLTFFPPLVFALLRGMPAATLALAANGLIATTLWTQMHWADALPIGDLRLLIGVYSATILILAAVVDERQLGRRRVTELRASEATLIENEKYFRTLANSAPVMMWVSGPNKLRVFCNKSWLEFTGRSLEQETGYGWTAALHPEDLDRSLATYVSSFDARRDYQSEARVRRADGEYRWILDRGVPLYREGRFAGYIGGCLDITEQKLFTDRLTASEARLRDAQRLAKVGHWARDVKTDTIVWSDEMNHILGVENGAPMGFKEFLECVHTRDRQKIEDCDRRVHASALPVEVEYRIRRRGGSIRQVRSIVEGIRNDRGELVSIVGATHDITEAVNTEEEMRRIRAALATAREDESSRIARDLHDDITLRLTLLAVALREAAAAPARQPEALVANLHSSQKEIFEICEGLRQISHQLHPSILNDVGLAMAIESLCDDFSERGGLPVWFHCGKLPPNIPPHVSSCLYRITQEALRNVVKHAHAPEVSVTLKRLGSAMELCIVDSGIGFDASVKRAGLGVQGMRERVTTVNGAFSIESNPGSGTRIVVRVPLRAERAQTSRQEQSGVAN